jgi:hypothetical protein
MTSRTSRIQPMYSYGRMPHAAPWTHHTAAHAKSLPALTKHLRLSCVAGRSLRHQTKSSLHTYWKGPSMTSVLSPTAHRPNPIALQPQQSHHQLRLCRLHAPVALYASQLVSTPKPSFPQGGDVGTTHTSSNGPFNIAALPLSA